MKGSRIGLFLVTLILLSSFFVSTALANDIIEVDIQGTCRYDYSYNVLTILNKERSTRGLSPLTMDQTLLKVGMQRAEECGLYYSHTRPNGTSCFSLFRNFAGGENIAVGYSTPDGVMNGWMNSSGHFANMMNGSYVSVGIGCFQDATGTFYWAQVFDRGTPVEASKMGNTSGSYTISSEKANAIPSVSPSSISITSGNTASIKTMIVNQGWSYASATPTADSFRYVSSNTAVATVSSAGVVTGVSSGNAAVSLRYRDGSSTGVSVSVKVNPKSLNDGKGSFSLAKTNYTYSGTAHTPDVTVKYESTTLKRDVDYSVTYSNNTAAGVGSAKIAGIGRYSGSTELKFTIAKKAITDSNIATKMEKEQYQYSGSAINAGVRITNGSMVLKQNTDYEIAYSNNKKIGTATAKVTGKGNYQGTITLRFQITKASVSSGSVTLSSDRYTYNGKAMKPTAKVIINGQALKKDTDYSISYSSNKNPGVAKATIKGKGNYTGQIVANFEILPKKAKISTVTSSSAGTVKIKWTKDTSLTGYEIQLSPSDAFNDDIQTITINKNKTTSATKSGLVRKQTYYARIRGFKTTGGKTYYGSWSDVKKVKTK